MAARKYTAGQEQSIRQKAIEIAGNTGWLEAESYLKVPEAYRVEHDPRYQDPFHPNELRRALLAQINAGLDYMMLCCHNNPDNRESIASEMGRLIGEKIKLEALVGDKRNGEGLPRKPEGYKARGVLNS